MTQAWQARDAKLQRFVEQMIHKIHDAHEQLDEEDNSFYFDVGINIMEFLEGHIEFVSTTADEKFFAELLSEVKQLARVPSEIDYVLYLFFEQLGPSMFSGITTAYQRDCMDREGEIYGGSRTREVQPDDEDD